VKRFWRWRSGWCWALWFVLCDNLQLLQATRKKMLLASIRECSYGIPGSYAPMLSEKRDSFLRLLKNNDLKEERMTTVGLYAIGTSTILESNKSQRT
jgi:hypothetical protein